MTNITKKEEKSLSIRLKEKQIADIIINFLGKKEKLKYEDETFFTLRLNDIEQFYYLINEKISKEQFTNVNLFTVTFLFNDKTTRVINTIESLNNYLETRDVIATAVTLTWHVVLQFPNVDTIETQKIELSFDTQTDIGEILLSIEHTNQSWGIEILNLMKDKILSVSYPISKNIIYAKKIKTTIYRDSRVIYFFMLMLFSIFFIALFSGPNNSENADSKNNLIVFENYKNNKITKEEFDDYSYIVEQIDSEKKIQLIENYINTKEKRILLEEFYSRSASVRRVRTAMTYGSIFLTVILILIYLYINKYIKFHSKKSYIVTTNRAEISYKEYENKNKKMHFYSISLIFFTLITGLIVNFIYSFI